MLVQESHRRFARRVPSRAWLPQRPLNIQGLVAISRPSWTSQFHFREMRTWSPFLRRFERFSAMGQMNRWTKPCYVLWEGKGPCHLQHQRKLNIELNERKQVIWKLKWANSKLLWSRFLSLHCNQRLVLLLKFIHTWRALSNHLIPFQNFWQKHCNGSRE